MNELSNLMNTASARSGLFAMILAIAALQTPAAGQPVAGLFQPDALDFGTVQVDATVEGSVLVIAAGDETAGVSVSVEPPAFVRVVDVELWTQNFGPLNPRTCCGVAVSIRTRAVGEHRGELVVKVADQRVAIPISANVVLKDANATRLLVVESPFTRYSAHDGSLFNPWRELVESANLNVDYWEVVNRQSVFSRKDLSQFDVILVGATGLVALTVDDVDALVTFAEQGGRVVLAANAFFRGTAEKANEILHYAALHMDDLEFREFGVVDVARENISEHAATAKVSKLAFSRPSPILVTDADRAKLLVRFPNAELEGIVAVGKMGKGDVIVLGQSLWWNWIAAKYSQGTDNALFLQQMLTHKK